MPKNENTISTDSLLQLRNDFTDLCQLRLTEGEEEYGEFAFLQNDMVQYAIEEVADLANYAGMLYIKLRLLGDALECK